MQITFALTLAEFEPLSTNEPYQDRMNDFIRSRNSDAPAGVDKAI